ncbi:MAG: class I SAM-dependent RNA methyltransferase [Gemmatimonadaceae bacterium]
MADSTLDLYSTTAPGLESLTAQELSGLGVAAPVPSRGGVEWRGSVRDLYQANLWLRTASRVLVRVSRFHAGSFAELERRAKTVPWGRFVRARDHVRFRVSCHRSALYHSDAVAERLAESVMAATGCKAPTADLAGSTAADEESRSGEQLFVVRVDRDRLTISADSSGLLLHKRGYRQALAKAPVRETLAAAMLLASWADSGTVLLDPMCGSGTIAIEAAMIARKIAPGIQRTFRFERWPGFDGGAWGELRAAAASGVLEGAQPVIEAADRDAGAIAAATSNAERAGVAKDIRLVQRSLSESDPAAGTGWIISNPPYGVRIGTDVRNLYASVGNLMRGPFAHWKLGLLIASPQLAGQIGLPLERLFGTSNGGIDIEFMVHARG